MFVHYYFRGGKSRSNAWIAYPTVITEDDFEAEVAKLPHLGNKITSKVYMNLSTSNPRANLYHSKH